MRALLLITICLGCGGDSDSMPSDGGADPEEWIATDISAVGVPQDVWVFSQDDVWIAGQHGIAHWNGVDVSLVPTGAPSEMVLGYGSLWGNAPNDLWAVGGGYLSHYDGASWTVRSGPDLAIQLPRAVYADGSTVWVGGNTESGFLVDTTWTTFDVGASDLWGTAGVVFSGRQRFADGQWTPLVGAPSGTVRVWGFGADDAWVATNQGSLSRCNTECTVVPFTLGPQGTVSGVFGRSATDVYGVGYRGTIVHFDGDEWSIVQQESTTSTKQLYTIHGDSDGTLWTVGVVGAGSPTALRNR